MQEFSSPHALINEIKDQLAQRGLGGRCFFEMLDYTVELFTTQGLGEDYYGYHNINHELEVTYVSLLATNAEDGFTEEDAKYMYAAALFHDFDPQKSVDKPHEAEVVKFISGDRKIKEVLADAGIDLDILKVLILRTAYPWRGKIRKDMGAKIAEYLEGSERARGDAAFREHVMGLGRYLSVIDRMAGYVLGDFAKAMEMAKMNAHSLGWKPEWITKRSVAYFEELFSEEAGAVKRILKILPRHMRKNFYDTILSFMRLRQQEITVQAGVAYENLKLVPTIETMGTRRGEGFIKSLHSIFLELPKPLQFMGSDFGDSVRNPDTILTTLRLNSRDGEVIGFAKGGPLEGYHVRPEIKDDNYGLGNTVFLEPIALKRGYWGFNGGSEIRHMFVMQAHAKKFKNLTSFALRDVIEARAGREDIEFVAKFDPEKWDYYRVRLESP